MSSASFVAARVDKIPIASRCASRRNTGKTMTDKELNLRAGLAAFSDAIAWSP